MSDREAVDSLSAKPLCPGSSRAKRAEPEARFMVAAAGETVNQFAEGACQTAQ